MILELEPERNGMFSLTSRWCSLLAPIRALPRVSVTTMSPTAERRGREVL